MHFFDKKVQKNEDRSEGNMIIKYKRLGFSR